MMIGFILLFILASCSHLQQPVVVQVEKEDTYGFTRYEDLSPQEKQLFDHYHWCVDRYAESLQLPKSDPNRDLKIANYKEMMEVWGKQIPKNVVKKVQ